jgi:phosphate starvation-inducible PhoH-like protein
MSTKAMRRGRQQAGTQQQAGQRPARDFNDTSNDNRRNTAPVIYKLTEEMKAKQQLQADLIDKNDFTFCIGPAGTGKTHIAMEKAVAALKAGEVDTILLARPAVEAGETIGFLPGGQNEKMGPYMRPLYDELDKQYGRGKWKDLIRSEGNRNPADDRPDAPIEVAPVGTMRGRTFERAFVILDEAQNLKPEELKMALTRLGPGSKMVITGDPQQIDLAPIKNEDGEEVTASGLMEFVEKLEGVEGVGVHRYTADDVMRHPTVKRIVDRLDVLERQAEKPQLNQPVIRPLKP